MAVAGWVAAGAECWVAAENPDRAERALMAVAAVAVLQVLVMLVPLADSIRERGVTDERAPRGDACQAACEHQSHCLSSASSLIQGMQPSAMTLIDGSVLE